MEGPRYAYRLWSFATFHSLGGRSGLFPAFSVSWGSEVMEGPNERTALASTSQYSAIIRTNNCCCGLDKRYNWERCHIPSILSQPR